MAQHPSLRSKEKSKQHRSVLKRYERVKELEDKEKWKDGDSVFGLPKLKILKFKIKKEKAAPAATQEGAAAEAPAAAGQETAKAKTPQEAKAGASDAKASPKKETGKKEGK